MREALGQRIRHYRELRNLSQADLATAMGSNTAKTTISAWENGRSWPEWGKLLSIAEKLDIDPAHLFESITAPPRKPGPEEALAVLAEFIKKPSLALARPPVVRVAALLDRLHDAELDHAADLINGIIQDREAAGADSPVEPS